MLILDAATLQLPWHELLDSLDSGLSRLWMTSQQFHNQRETLAKLVLEVLGTSEAAELAWDHDGQAVAQGLTFLHTKKETKAYVLTMYFFLFFSDSGEKVKGFFSTYVVFSELHALLNFTDKWKDSQNCILLRKSFQPIEKRPFSNRMLLFKTGLMTPDLLWSEKWIR